MSDHASQELRRSASYLRQEIQELAPIIEGALKNINVKLDSPVTDQIEQEVANLALRTAKADGQIDRTERLALFGLCDTDSQVHLSAREDHSDPHRYIRLALEGGYEIDSRIGAALDNHDRRFSTELLAMYCNILSRVADIISLADEDRHSAESSSLKDYVPASHICVRPGMSANYSPEEFRTVRGLIEEVATALAPVLTANRSEPESLTTSDAYDAVIQEGLEFAIRVALADRSYLYDQVTTIRALFEGLSTHRWTSSGLSPEAVVHDWLAIAEEPTSPVNPVAPRLTRVQPTLSIADRKTGTHFESLYLSMLTRIGELVANRDLAVTALEREVLDELGQP